MPSVRCPACDEDMEIEADWYGRKVACPSCDTQFVARRPGEAADDADEPDARPKRRRAWDEDDDEPDDRPKKKVKKKSKPVPMGRGTRQLILAAAILGPILLVCLGCGGWGAFVIYSPVKYPDPWVTQPLPDGSYSMQFPRRPQSDNSGDEFGFGGSGTVFTLEEDGAKDGVFVFGFTDGLDEPLDVAFQEVIRQIKVDTKAKASAPRLVTSAGLSGKEVEFTIGGGKVIYRMLDASQGGRRRYVRVMAGGRSVSDADRTKFLDSLKRGP